MAELRVKTYVNLNGMDKIKELIKHQHEILKQLEENVSEIGKAQHELHIELSVGNSTNA